MNHYMDHEKKEWISSFLPTMNQFHSIQGKIVSMTKNSSLRSSLISGEQRESVESQVYCLTRRILRLTHHLEMHRRDYSSRRGLRQILGKRKRLLVHLSKRDILRYDDSINQLGLRGLKTR